MDNCPLCGHEVSTADFQVDLNFNYIRAGPKFIRVPAKVAEFAEILRRAYPDFAHKDRLMVGLYGNSSDPPYESILAAFACNLRNVLARTGWTVGTVPRKGYILQRGEGPQISEQAGAVLAAIKDFLAEHGRAPSCRDILDITGASRSGVYHAIRVLNARGLIRVRRLPPHGRQLIEVPE